MPLTFLTVPLMVQNLRLKNVLRLTLHTQINANAFFFPSFPQQAHLLLPRQPADGCEARTVQSPLLDLEQLVGGV